MSGKNEKKLQSKVAYISHLSAQMKAKDEQLKTARSEMSVLKKHLETKELEVMDKNKEIYLVKAKLNSHVQLLQGAIQDIQMLQSENKYLKTYLVINNQTINDSQFHHDQYSQVIEDDASNSVLMETVNSTNTFKFEETGNGSNKFSSMMVETNSNLFSTSSILASMRGLSLGHVKTKNSRGKNEKVVQIRKEIVLPRPPVAFYSSAEASFVSSISSADSSISGEDQNSSLLAIPPTPSPKKITLKTPTKKLERIAETEDENESDDDDESNSEDSPTSSGLLFSSESGSSYEDSKLSANLHSTFSIASSDCWAEPELDELKITNHQLYKNKSGYVLVKIEQDNTQQRQTRLSCKEKRLLHYVALLTGEKYSGSSRYFRSLFFKRVGIKGFVKDKTHLDQCLEVVENNIVCHLPFPDVNAKGTLHFTNFNFKNYLLGW